MWERPGTVRLELEKTGQTRGRPWPNPRPPWPCHPIGQTRDVLRRAADLNDTTITVYLTIDEAVAELARQILHPLVAVESAALIAKKITVPTNA